MQLWGAAVKRILVVAILLLPVLVIGGIWAVSSLMDWNQHKGAIVKWLEAKTGLPVRIDGDLTLELLPEPTFRAAGLRVPDTHGGRHLLTVDSIDMTAALGALLRGRIEVETATLVRPVLNFELGEASGDGANARRLNWDLSFLTKLLTGPDTLAAESGGGGPLGMTVMLDGMRIENGAIHYRTGQDAADYALTGLAARVKAASLYGPFDLRGQGAMNGYPIQIDLMTQPASTSGLPIALDVTGTDGSQALAFNGAARTDVGGATLTGSLSVDVDAVDRAARIWYPDSDPLPVPARRLELTSSVSFGDDRIDLDDLAVVLGRDRFAGQIAYRGGAESALDMGLSFEAFDLTPFLDGAGASGQLSDLVPTLTRFGALSVDLRADRVVAGTGSLSGVSINVSNGSGKRKLAVNRFDAVLPGEVAIKATGRIDFADTVPRPDLAVELTGASLRDTLAWIGLPLDKVPESRLRQISASGRINGMTAALTRFEDLDIEIDTTRVSGSMSYERRPGSPRIEMVLKANRLNLDSYLPESGMYAKTDSLAGLTEGLSREDVDALTGRDPGATDAGASPGPVRRALPIIARIVEALGRQDGRLELSADQLTLADAPIQAVSLIADSDGTGRLEIAELALSGLHEASLSAAGGIASSAGALSVDKLSVDLSTKDAVPLVEALGLRLPLLPGKLGETQLHAELTGDLDSLQVISKARFDSGHFEAGGEIVAPLGAWRYTGDINLKHDSFRRLLDLSRLSYRPRGETFGGFELSGKADLDATAARFTDASLWIGELKGEGRFGWDLSGLVAQLSADLAFDFLAPLPYMPAGPDQTSLLYIFNEAPLPDDREALLKSKVVLPMLGSYEGDFSFAAADLSLPPYAIEDWSARFTVKDKELTISRFEGGFRDGRIALSGQAGQRGVPTIEGKLELSGVAVKESLLFNDVFEAKDGALDMVASFHTRGDMVFDVLSALHVDGRFEMRDGLAIGLGVAKIRSQFRDFETVADPVQVLRHDLSHGVSAFERISGVFQIRDGILKAPRVAMAFEGVTGDAALHKADLIGRQVHAEAMFAAAAVPELGAFGVTVTGDMDFPDRAFTMAALQDFVDAQEQARRDRLRAEEEARQARIRAEEAARQKKLARQEAEAEEARRRREQAAQEKSFATLAKGDAPALPRAPAPSIPAGEPDAADLLSLDPPDVAEEPVDAMESPAAQLPMEPPAPAAKKLLTAIPPGSPFSTATLGGGAEPVTRIVPETEYQVLRPLENTAPVESVRSVQPRAPVILRGPKADPPPAPLLTGDAGPGRAHSPDFVRNAPRTAFD